MTTRIDMNCDMGESYGAWTMGNDAAVLQYVSSANIACGFHGGDRVRIGHRVVRDSPLDGRAAPGRKGRQIELLAWVLRRINHWLTITW